MLFSFLQTVARPITISLYLCVLYSTALIIPPKARPVIIGTSDYSNILFGKLQRAASLWGSNLDQPMTIISDGDSEQRLLKCLWNQFVMADKGPDGILDEPDLIRPLSVWIPQANIEGAVLFFDAVTPPGEAPDFSAFLSSIFSKKENVEKDTPSVKLNKNIVECAGTRKAGHIYVLACYESLADCKKTLEDHSPTVPSTIVCIDQDMSSTPDWVSSRPQNMDGEFVGAIQVSSDDDRIASATDLNLKKRQKKKNSSVLPAEDAAEIILQISLRTNRSPTDYPKIVFLHSGGEALQKRLNSDYFTMVGGKKAKELAGTVQSISSWESLLGPAFGEINTALGERPDIK